MSSLHERNYPSAPKKKKSKMDLLVRVTAILMVLLMVGTLVGSVILSFISR